MGVISLGRRRLLGRVLRVYKDDLELEDAVHIALLTLKETIEGEMNGETIEIGKRSY